MQGTVSSPPLDRTMTGVAVGGRGAGEGGELIGWVSGYISNDKIMRLMINLHHLSQLKV